MGLVYETMERFLAACSEKYTEKSLKRFRSDLNVASHFEEAEGLSLTDLSGSELKRLLISYHCFSVQSFRDKKSLLLQYFRWLEEQGFPAAKTAQILVEMDYNQIGSDNEFGKYYFGSFSQLVLFLQAHINRAAEERDKDKAEFLTSAVLCTLAWHGLSAASACLVQKTDLFEEEGMLLLRLPAKTIHLEPEGAAWIRAFLSARGFERLKGGVWETVSYREGNALLRTTKADSMTPKSVAGMLTRFNACLPDADKVFLYARIYSSGKFYRAYLRERDDEIFLPVRKESSPVRAEERELYGMLFETTYGPEDHSRLLREIRLYQEFKQYFYSEAN